MRQHRLTFYLYILANNRLKCQLLDAQKKSPLFTRAFQWHIACLTFMRYTIGY